MHENGSSTYYDSEHLAMGYSLCMLKARGRALSGYYPYLQAITRELEEPDVVGRLIDTTHRIRLGAESSADLSPPASRTMHLSRDQA